MSDRLPLLGFCTARELHDLMWRAIRERNKYEMLTIREEYKRRNVGMKTEMYGAMNRTLGELRA